MYIDTHTKESMIKSVCATSKVSPFELPSIENVGIPFSVQHKSMPRSLQEAVYDSRFQRNLHDPFDTAEDAVSSMLED